MIRLLVRVAAIAAVLLTLGGAKVSAGMKEGYAAYDRGDYATAMREWRPLAEQGDADAQFNLGFMFSKRSPTRRDSVCLVRQHSDLSVLLCHFAQDNTGDSAYSAYLDVIAAIGFPSPAILDFKAAAFGGASPKATNDGSAVG